MKTKKYKFTISTPISGSEYSEELEIYFEQNSTEEEMEKEVEEVYLDWVELTTLGEWEEILDQ